MRDFFGITDVDSITFLNPYDIQAYEKQVESGDIENVLKSTIRDVVLDFTTGMFTSEMQLHKNNVFHKRALYYPFTTFNSRYGIEFESDEASRYKTLKPAYFKWAIADEPGDNAIS